MSKSRRGIAFLLAVMLFIASLPVALAANSTGTINTDKVFFRSQPKTDAVYYSMLKKGDKVTVTGTSGSFYAVTVGKVKGYVMKKFVTLAGAAAAATSTSSTSTSTTNKYASATSISALGSAPAATSKGSSGDSVFKLQQALKIKGYLKGTVDGKYGDVTANAVKAFQKSAGLSQTGKADKTTIAKLFGTSASASDPKMSGITKISDIKVPATTAKGSSGKNVLALQQALKLKGYYKATINSKYDETTVAAVKAFQKAKGLYQDGIAGNNTIKALFGQNASNYSMKTERLDWAKSANTIPRGATFQVKDVLTGKTFSAKRLFGANHMDSEPLTKTDSATLKSVYGGNYSWNRRAILVKYNGHIYAASMNGYPHGTSTIDNNWPGHFCIHFYNSKTHESNKVDAAHQNCVARAMNATW